MTSQIQHKILYRSFRFLKALFVLIAGIMSSVVGFLVAAADTPENNDNGPDSLSRGVLNYRTGKLDDGTDPYGWYEND